MGQTLKESSVYVYLKDTNTLPFPDLDQIKSQLIPFYDFSENLQINGDIFQSEYGFVNSHIDNRVWITITLAVFCFVFLVLGVGANVVYCKKYKKANEIIEDASLAEFIAKDDE